MKNFFRAKTQSRKEELFAVIGGFAALREYASLKLGESR
jgi:hypothetical protein